MKPTTTRFLEKSSFFASHPEHLLSLSLSSFVLCFVLLPSSSFTKTIKAGRTAGENANNLAMTVPKAPIHTCTKSTHACKFVDKSSMRSVRLTGILLNCWILISYAQRMPFAAYVKKHETPLKINHGFSKFRQACTDS